MKKGLVLEGGGAKGSYQIGAYKALKELGYEFDYIVGASIGAINGAIFTQGDEEIAEEIWRNIKYSTVVKADDSKIDTLLNEDLSFKNIVDKVYVLKDLIALGGFDTTPLKKLLVEHIDEDKIRNSSTKFGLVTIDLTNRKPVEIFVDEMEEGTLVNYIYGSSNLLVFKQEPIDGRYLIDGGYYENNPVKMLEDKCDEIVNIILYPNRFKGKLRADLDYKAIVPTDKLPDILSFTANNAKFGIDLGYYDTYKYFRNLLGSKYYIEGFDSDFAVQVFSKLYEYVDNYFPYINNKRYFFEKWLPQYFSSEKLDSKIDYDEALVLLMEKIANKVGVERFCIYNIRTFADKIYEDKDFKINLNLQLERELIKIIKKMDS